MPPFRTLSLIAFLAVSPALHADDTQIASPLVALGAKIVAKDGIITQLTLTDSSKVGEAELRAIGQLSHLKSLTLYGKLHGLTDSTAPLLSGLKELESLGTDGAQLTDDGLKHLGALISLKSLAFFHLSFNMKGFTGAGFAHLKPLTRLEKLTVAGISMGDEGFAAIGTLTQLKEFRTWHTFQTEAGNDPIAGLSSLTSLQLGQRLPGHGNKAPSLSDVTLPKLTKLQALETLKLGEAHFTVETLLALKALPKLKTLSLSETDLTAEDVEKLRQGLPGIKIDWQPLTEEQRKKFDQYLKG